MPPSIGCRRRSILSTAEAGRPSIPPEKLLRALLLQALFSIRSERQLMQQISYNMLFRWFVGLAMDVPVWDVTVWDVTWCSRRRAPVPADHRTAWPDPRSDHRRHRHAEARQALGRRGAPVLWTARQAGQLPGCGEPVGGLGSGDRFLIQVAPSGRRSATDRYRCGSAVQERPWKPR